MSNKHKPFSDVQGSMERIVGVALMRNGAMLMGNGKYTSHAELRHAINPSLFCSESVKGDIEGFVTSRDRFVNRDEAKSVGVASGQLRPIWKNSNMKLLSSSIDWE